MVYRAIVIFDLAGGNDWHDTIMPIGTTGPASYSDYAAARGSMAKAQNTILALPSTPYGLYGLHPNLPAVQAIAQAGGLAIIANIGTLVQPTTRATYLNGSATRPSQLFSHSDQQRLWAQTSGAAATNVVGWGAQVAAAVASTNGSNSGLTMVSFSGSGKVVEGCYSATVDGPAGLYGSWSGLHDDLADILNLTPTASGYETPLVEQVEESIALAATVRAYWPIDDDPAWMPYVSATAPDGFPTTAIGNALRGVAKMISLRSSLGMERQVFHVRMGGFDTHNDNGTHDLLMVDLNQALRAFNAAVNAMDADVLTYVYSEFGRTLRTNGNGSDHAWGGHAMVIGHTDILKAGVYGTMPTLKRDGEDDIGLGRLVPKVAHEQPAAQLATWMGATAGSIFPNLGAFPTLATFYE